MTTKSYKEVKELEQLFINTVLESSKEVGYKLRQLNKEGLEALKSEAPFKFVRKSKDIYEE